MPLAQVVRIIQQYWDIAHRGRPLARALETISSPEIATALAIASTFLAARYLGAAAGAVISGLWVAFLGLSWNRQTHDLGRSVEHFSRLALLDDLTGLANDRSFREGLAMYTDQAGEPAGPLSLVLIDVDGFKSYNDSFGHPAGDEALRAFGRCLVASSTGDVRVYRVGGDEFALILPTTGRSAAREVAESVRVAIGRQAWPLRPITASFGVASLADGPDLMERADRMLYRAKAMGGDRVVVDQPEDDRTKPD